MYDGASRSDTSHGADTFQRANGELRVSVKRRGEASVLDGLRQAGCLKARFSRPVVAGWFDVTMVNTSGGVAGGDRLDTAISVGPGARATIAAQAAERFYRALPDSAPSRVRTSVTVAAGAAAEWLPQETILFDRCALDRRLTVDMAPDASFLGVEILVFGRAAMGERVVTARLRDQFRVRRDGVWLLHDTIRLEGDCASVLAQPALMDGAGAVATLVHVAPDAEARLDALRAALASSDASGSGSSGSGASGSGASAYGASAWNGMLVARFVAHDGAAARRMMMAALAVLREGRALPRVWAC